MYRGGDHMSYKVQYHPELNGKYPGSSASHKRSGTKIIILSLLAIFVGTLFVKNDILQYLIPGNPEVTAAAFATLVNEVGEGESVTEAIMHFCNDIIQFS